MSAAGKSAAAAHLATYLEAPLYGIGRRELEVAQLLGYRTIQDRYDREGIRTYADLVPMMVDEIKRLPSPCVVVESIYDRPLLDGIRRCRAAASVVLICLSASRHSRRRRFADRASLDLETARRVLARRDAEKRFLGVASIMAQGDCVVRTDGREPAEIAREIAAFLESTEATDLGRVATRRHRIDAFEVELAADG